MGHIIHHQVVEITIWMDSLMKDRLSLALDLCFSLVISVTGVSPHRERHQEAEPGHAAHLQ